MNNAYKVGNFADDLQTKIDNNGIKGLTVKNQKTVTDAALALKFCGKVAILIQALVDQEIDERTFERRIKDIEKDLDRELKIDK